MEKTNVVVSDDRMQRLAPGIVFLIGIMNIILSSVFAQSGYNFAIFTGLMILTGVSVPFIRMLNVRSYKVIAYIFIGFAAYWVVGTAYNDPDMFGQFLPVVIFALANAIAILISIVDGRDSGYIYSSMGFTVVIYNILIQGNLDYVGGKPDMLLLVAVFWALIPMLWCYSLSEITSRLTFNAKKRFFSTVVTGISVLPIYILLGLVIITSQGTRIFNIPSISSIGQFFSSNPQIIEILIGASWFYMLAHTIAVLIAFFSNELVLHAFKIKKAINDEDEIIYIVEKKLVEQKIETEDPYKNIIKEMKTFKREFGAGKINRLVATQTLGKIRNEMDLLVAKYDHGSKESAEKLLMDIEKEIEFAFR
ncbi:MAG: hypothetical protein M8350_00865 [Methanosarcinaceae archaeon]|nr:hypothetical protein [Methanosarcinaceae archaeon]